ncbi:hypothetical protein ACVWW3_003142 [Bradyrhizobium sp. LM2.9]
MSRDMSTRPMSSKLGHSGTPSVLLDGRKSIRRRICSSVSTSFSKAPSAIEERVACTEAPPSSSAVTTSLVTVFTTSGPVTNM